MKKLLFMIVIAIFLTDFLVLSQTCSQSKRLYQMTTSCDTNFSTNFDQMLLSLWPPITALTIYTSVKIKDACGYNDIGLIHIGLTSADGSQVEIFSIYYDLVNNLFGWSHQHVVGTIFNSPQNMLDQWVSISMSIDLSTGALRAGIWSIFDISTYSDTIPSLTAYRFDTSTKLRLCAADGDNHVTAGCNYFGFKVAYKFIDDPIALALLDETTLIGSYQFLEGLGYSSQNLALGENSLPSITLGIDYNRTLNLVEKGSGGANQDDKPQWLTGNPGVEFTSTSRYMTVSGIRGAGPAWNFGYSLGLSVWILIATTPTSIQTVFRYSTSDERTDLASVQLTQQMQIQVNLGGVSLTSNSMLQINTWTQIVILMDAVSFSYPIPGKCYIHLFFGTTPQGTFADTCSPTTDQGNNLITGGFVGQIQDLLVFKAPAAYISSPSCSSGVAVSLGTSDPEISLLRSPCPNGLTARSSPSSCYSCSAVCTSCNDNLDCQTCIPGYYIDGTSCSQCPIGTYAETRSSSSCEGACPTGCAVCAEPSICQACKPGYSFHISQCSQCGAGTFALTSTSSVCSEGCPNTCATCTSSSQCQTCNKGYGLVNNQCVPCQKGTYPTPTSCENCPDACADCTDSSLCTSCKTGYGLVNNQCVTCRNGTYPTSTSCEDCPKTCDTCTDFSVCTSCKPDYGLVNNQCVTCPAGTHPTSTSCLAGVDNTTDDGSQNSNESSGLDISSSEIIIGIISIIIVGIITFIVTKYQSVKVSDTDNNENAMDKKAQMELSSMLVLDSSGSAEIKTSSIQL